MANEQPEYLAYLLRLWRVTAVGAPVWRASLEDPHSGEQRIFPDLGTLYAFLQAQTAGPAPEKA